MGHNTCKSIGGVLCVVKPHILFYSNGLASNTVCKISGM